MFPNCGLFKGRFLFPYLFLSGIITWDFLGIFYCPVQKGGKEGDRCGEQTDARKRRIKKRKKKKRERYKGEGEGSGEQTN